MAKQNCIKKKITASAGYEYILGKRTQIKKTETVLVPISIINNPKKFDAFIEKERERIRQQLEVERQTAKSDLTFRQYAKKVAERKREQGDIRSITEQSNTSIMDYINTLVGDYKLKDIDKEIVDMVKAKINNKPSTRGGIISDKTKYNYFSYFRSVINAAEEDKYYTESPLLKVKNFSFETEETTYLEKDELLFVMRSLNEFHIKVQIEILLELYTGTRRGEVLSLRWADIKQDSKGVKYFDLKEGFYYTKEEKYFRGTLKTPKSRRKLTIHPFLFGKLEEYRFWQDAEEEKWGDAWKGSGYIICKDDGSNYNPDYFTKKISKVFEKIGFDDITTHSLRRSFASLADDENETTSKIAALLGQANVLVTDRNYILRSKKLNDVSFLGSIIIEDDSSPEKAPKKQFKRLKRKSYKR